MKFSLYLLTIRGSVLQSIYLLDLPFPTHPLQVSVAEIEGVLDGASPLRSAGPKVKRWAQTPPVHAWRRAAELFPNIYNTGLSSWPLSTGESYELERWLAVTWILGLSVSNLSAVSTPHSRLLRRQTHVRNGQMNCFEGYLLGNVAHLIGLFGIGNANVSDLEYPLDCHIC